MQVNLYKKNKAKAREHAPVRKDKPPGTLIMLVRKDL